MRSQPENNYYYQQKFNFSARNLFPWSPQTWTRNYGSGICYVNILIHFGRPNPEPHWGQIHFIEKNTNTPSKKFRCQLTRDLSPLSGELLSPGKLLAGVALTANSCCGCRCCPSRELGDGLLLLEVRPGGKTSTDGVCRAERCGGESGLAPNSS